MYASCQTKTLLLLLLLRQFYVYTFKRFDQHLGSLLPPIGDISNCIFSIDKIIRQKNNQWYNNKHICTVLLKYIIHINKYYFFINSYFSSTLRLYGSLQVVLRQFGVRCRSDTTRCHHLTIPSFQLKETDGTGAHFKIKKMNIPYEKRKFYTFCVFT